MKTNLLEMAPLTPGVCEWCGNPCEEEDVACSISCEAQLARLEAAQGRRIVRILKRWRKHRGRKGTPGEGTMTEAATLIDKFLKKDRQRREAHQHEKRMDAARAAADAQAKAAEKRASK